MTHWQRFVSQLKRDAERKALFDFVADDRTCSEQSERNSETGEFIRYSEASTLNKLCLSHNRALHGHYVLYLFAMSAAFDVRKCLALASLFVCVQLHGRAGCKQSFPTMQFALSQVRHRSIKDKKRTPKGSFYSCLVRMTGLEPARACTRT